MSKILLAWMGYHDLGAPGAADETEVGPIARALVERSFDRVILLDNYDDEQKKKAVRAYLKWLKGQTDAQIEHEYRKLPSPTDFLAIYKAVVDLLEGLHKAGGTHELSFHLSAGTPAMSAVWILVGRSIFPAELLQSSKESGVVTANIPFDLAVDFLPDLLRKPDAQLGRGSLFLPPETPGFEDINYKSRVMGELLGKAQRVAIRSIPVLIEGESGTGKELLARAIHQASPRKHQEIITINCGAIPDGLVESALFGHAKGAFTGADRERAGCFEKADGSTLFMDELGELPLAAQVKLLRVLQQGEVTRIGETEPRKIDVRIIAATNRTLIEEVSAGRFREDLFYRLAVAKFTIPPLREREGDVGLLLARFLDEINALGEKEEPGYTPRQLSARARNVFLHYPWPGNVRELYNTLQRASIWSSGEIITEDDAREALLTPTPSEGNILGRPLDEDFSLESVVSEVARHYMERAYVQAGGVKTRAARLVGFDSHQRFDKWAQKHGVELTDEEHR